MARKTRAAAKAVTDSIHVDDTATTGSDSAASPEAQTVQGERRPLIEIMVNELEQRPPQEIAEEETPTKKSKGKHKKKSGKKKGKKTANAQRNEEIIDREVGQIELNVVPAESASVPKQIIADIAGNVTQEATAESTAAANSDITTQTQLAINEEHDAQPNTITSTPSIPEASKHTAGLDLGASQAGQRLEQLFVPQPVKDEDTLKEPSIEDILKNSNGVRQECTKEDPIEAMDALEEAIEEVGKSLPNLDMKKKAPKLQLGKKSTYENVQLNAVIAEQTLKHPKAALKNAAKKPAASKPVLARVSNARQDCTTSGTTDGQVAAISAKLNSASPEATSIKGDAPTKKKSDIVALHTPVKQAKSTKPVTKSVFQLPGEAIAAKLKAEREERIKRKEEAAEKEVASKPKPVLRTSKAVEVKQTAASRARMSLMIDKPIQAQRNTSAEMTRPAKRTTGVMPASAAERRASTLAHRPKPVARESTVPGSTTLYRPQNPRPQGDANQRHSTIFSSTPKQVHAANTARARVPSNGAATAATAAPKAPMTSQNLVAQRQKAREVFNREKLEKDALDKARKEKEDATKKARAEAAEKGRTASREWAEKMRAKNRAAAAANAVAAQGKVGELVKAIEA